MSDRLLFFLFLSFCRLFSKLLEAGHQKSSWQDGAWFFCPSSWCLIIDTWDALHFHTHDTVFVFWMNLPRACLAFFEMLVYFHNLLSSLYFYMHLFCFLCYIAKGKLQSIIVDFWLWGSSCFFSPLREDIYSWWYSKRPSDIFLIEKF